MRITKRIEAYIYEQVNTIANIKRQAIESKYAEAENVFKAFIQRIDQCCESLNNELEAEMKKFGYEYRHYYDARLIESKSSSISSPATSEKMKELRTIDKWVNEQTNLLCVKMEMGGDMDTLTKMLEELKASLG